MLTASSEWSAWQPLARTPLDGFRARRLAPFVTVSLVLHALALGASIPGSGGQDSLAAPEHRVLHAALVQHVPEQRAEAAREATADEWQQDAASVASQPTPSSSAAESGARGMVQMPVPERWYEAAELDTRAEPLTPVEPVYPAELAGLSAAPAKVRLRLFIDERGTVRKLEIEMGGPRPEFDEAAKRTWENVRFSPALKDGATVKSQKLLELAFAP